MSFERARPWFRVLTLLLAFGMAIVLPLQSGGGRAYAQQSAQQLFEAGVEAYKLVELEKAEQTLLQAAALLQSQESADPEARRLSAQVHLYLGRVTLVADKPDQAKVHFRKALELDPSLVMVTETDPPRIVQAFEAARGELVASVPPTPQPQVQPTAVVAAAQPTQAPAVKRKKRWVLWAIGGAAVAAAGIVALGAGGGDDGDSNAMLEGNWVGAINLGTNTCGNEEYSIFFKDNLRLMQNGSSVTITSNEGLPGSLNGSINGNRLSFGGMVQSGDGTCNTTEVYRNANGDAAPGGNRINGNFSLELTRVSVGSGGPVTKTGDRSLLPPCDFQCTYQYSFNMSR